MPIVNSGYVVSVNAPNKHDHVRINRSFCKMASMEKEYFWGKSFCLSYSGEFNAVF